MLVSLLKTVRGYLWVTLTGGAPERFLNLCARHDILIWNLQPEAGGGFRFCISRRGLAAAEAYVQRTHCTLTVQRRCGLPFFMQMHKARKMFLIGMLLSILLLWQCSGYVWRIEVCGTEQLSEDMIRTWLDEKEQSFGTKKTKIDCAALEAALREEFSVVAWTSVRLSGTCLTVDIKERLSEQAADTLPSDDACDLVASEQAEISSICTRSGTPLVSAGDTVSEGAVLISGRLDILDDNGEVSQYRYVTADGDVTGIVERSYEATLPRACQKKVYTGEVRTTRELWIGALRIPLSGKAASFDACETLVTDHQAELLEHLYLPVHLYVTTQKPYVYEPYVYTKQEVEAHARAGWESFLEKFTQKGIPIIVKNVKIETNEKNCVIRGSIEAELPLGAYAPTERLSPPAETAAPSADDALQE